MSPDGHMHKVQRSNVGDPTLASIQAKRIGKGLARGEDSKVSPP